jgi:3-dehydroquinate synthase
MLLDICGFACAIYMRGVSKVIYIPTTLLAIVDATVGGKTGVNWGGAKNMLGVISHPTEIRINLHYLDTLPDRDFSNGLAEVIKMALTHDSHLFSIL